MHNGSTPGLEAAPDGTARGSVALAEVTGVRMELERERARRLQAEARAAAAEERASVAEWLVAVLRSELIGPEQPQRRWRWPWQR